MYLINEKADATSSSSTKEESVHVQCHPIRPRATDLACSGWLDVRASTGTRGQSLRVVESAALAALTVCVVGAATVIGQGPQTSALLGLNGLGFSIRLDAVSLTMALLVSFIGWVVSRYARTYMDGETAQAAFMGWLGVALGSVLLLVTAGNVVQLVVGWIGAGIAVQRLLLTYATRTGAQLAGRKKAMVNTGSNGALVLAAIMLYAAAGTGDIATLLAEAEATWMWTFAAILLAVSAMLASAQVPFHGWLTEVMEAPTPVSALLHAGVVNAGGFLLIRFADLILLNPVLLSALVFLGGASALIGSIVMLTQPAIKTALAWSTIAQMGFMILQCGLGLFALALLHIVAHSLYKAHAFLSSGGAVGAVAAIPRPGPVAVPNGRAVLRAFGIAVVIFAAIATLFGLAGKSPQALAMGAVLVFGVAYMLAQGLADSAPKALTQRMAVASLATTIGYFSLQTLAVWITAGTLPPAPIPGALGWFLIGITVISFGLLAMAQACFPLWVHHPAAQGLRVHISNGFYLNAVLDRMIGSWSKSDAKGA